MRGRCAPFFGGIQALRASGLVLALVFLAVGCSSKPATKPEPQESKLEIPTPGAVDKTVRIGAREGQFWVVRPDGSKSCGVRKGHSAKHAAQELESAGIKVLKSRSGHDGKMRMMVCGADTGQQVELFIDGSGLPVASQKGFRVKGEH